MCSVHTRKPYQIFLLLLLSFGARWNIWFRLSCLNIHVQTHTDTYCIYITKHSEKLCQFYFMNSSTAAECDDYLRLIHCVYLYTQWQTNSFFIVAHKIFQNIEHLHRGKCIFFYLKKLIQNSLLKFGIAKIN